MIRMCIHNQSEFSIIHAIQRFSRFIRHGENNKKNSQREYLIMKSNLVTFMRIIKKSCLLRLGNTLLIKKATTFVVAFYLFK